MYDLALLAITLYYFSNKKKKQGNDRLSDMLSFVCFFVFNQSEKNVVLDPRTGHFRGHVSFEIKTKDLSFEAKAKTKDLKMSPRRRSQGQGCPRGTTSGFDRPEI